MRIFTIIVVLALILAIGLTAYVYWNKQDILDKGLDSILKRRLPGYIELDSLKVNLQRGSIAIKGFKLRNPKGFNSPYLAEIADVNALYTQVDKRNILRGISLSDIELSGARIFLERNKKGTLNIEGMEGVLKDTRPREKPGIKTRLDGLVSYLLGPVKNIGQLLHIDPVFNINNGTFFFKDYYIDTTGYSTTVEEISGTIKIDLRGDLKGIDYIISQGHGLVNARQGQSLTWAMSYNPTNPRLTMSNTFDIEGVDITHFKPYYDRYSPFIFKKGSASGRLVLNLDNGQIGSDNEILFSGFEIEQKQDHSFNRFWPSGADDLYRYFSSEQGDIVFDFKIKGPMDEPRFYLGSKTKRALAYMVFDKVTDRIFKKSEDVQDDDSQQPSPDTPQQEKTGLERVLDILQGF
jgi:hypothetical protein